MVSSNLEEDNAPINSSALQSINRSIDDNDGNRLNDERNSRDDYQSEAQIQIVVEEDSYNFQNV